MKTYKIPSGRELITLAKKAGAIMRKNFENPGKVTAKNDGSFLSETDEQIDRLVVNYFTTKYPHISIITEESEGKAGKSDLTMMCDAIDGTHPFLQGMPISTFIISILQSGQPIIAIIYDPFRRRIYHALRGEGAYVNNKPLRVSDHPSINDAKVCIPVWKNSAFKLPGVYEKLMTAGVMWTNHFSIGYEGTLVACGFQDATVLPEKKGWETSAIALLVEEAGGKATDIYGKPIKYGPKGEIDGHIISNGRFHDNLVELIGSSLN